MTKKQRLLINRLEVLRRARKASSWKLFLFFFDAVIKNKLFLRIISPPTRAFMSFFRNRLYVVKRAKTFFGEEIHVPVPPRFDLVKWGALLEFDPEVRLTKFLIRNIGPKIVFFDIGSNYGYYSLLVFALSENAKIFSFEPDPGALSFLRRNKRENIEIIPKAVGEKDGRVNFYSNSAEFSDISTTDIKNFEDFPLYIPYKEIVVDMVRLDSFCKTKNVKPDLIKIDVEGGEARVLKSMSNLLDSRDLLIVMEIRTDPIKPQYIEAIKILQSHGFGMFSINREGVLNILEVKNLKRYAGELNKSLKESREVYGFDNLVFKKMKI